MTNEEAARILDPKTTLEVYAETEYYSGFDGAKRWKEAVDEACIIGAKALREQSSTDTNVGGKWISVEDRLPNTDVRVLVALISKNGNKGIDDCFYSFKKNKFLLYSTLEEIPEIIIVTHWQPLPEPPTE